jgi:signal transduction histidine kinase
MQDLSLHVLDVAENSIAAGARRIDITLEEKTGEDLFVLSIRDDGKGMDEEMAARALDPFFTTKKGKRVGLGLPMLGQAAREAGGTIEVISRKGKGTTVRATFRASHPDCRPLGDMRATVDALRAGRPDLVVRYAHRRIPGRGGGPRARRATVGSGTGEREAK